MELARLQPEWMDLQTLGAYASVSDKTLRSWIHSARDPLPANQRGNKLYVKRAVFDVWMERQKLKKKAVDLNRMVEKIVTSVRR